MHTIAVSACLLGVPCRYDGGSKPNEEVIAFLKDMSVMLFAFVLR